jgi:hypothetical protein
MNVEYEPAVAEFCSDFCIRQIARYLQYAFKTAVSDFELVVAPALGYHRIPPHSADNQAVADDPYFDVARLDARKIELDPPAVRAAVNIHGRLP